MILRRVILAAIALFVVSCGSGGNDPVQPELSPPRIVGLKIEPNVVCVGGSAEVTFTLSDGDPGTITWNAVLNSSVHGTLSATTGTGTDGTIVDIHFKAATSGRHQHRVAVTVIATDSAGRRSEPSTIEFFVFNC